MPTKSSPSNHKIKVFIADDSYIVQERLELILTELASVEIVGLAKTVAKATSDIVKLQPDLVILDIRLSDGSGIDVLQAIKQAEPRPVIIILTNYPYQAYQEKCLQAGADFFLDKSTEFDQIPELLEQLIPK